MPDQGPEVVTLSKASHRGKRRRWVEVPERVAALLDGEHPDADVGEFVRRPEDREAAIERAAKAMCAAEDAGGAGWEAFAEAALISAGLIDPVSGEESG